MSGSMAETATAVPVVAIAGNPNVGKTSIFNRLTGSRLKVTNYPGVTVERHEADLGLPGRTARILDIPGTYSLSSRSGEEQIALAAIAGLPPATPPDAVVVVVDATQLSRNLYLVLQVMELGLPVVVALNMVDQLGAVGRSVDSESLERALGVPVVEVSGLRGQGIDALRERIDTVLQDPGSARPGWRWLPSDPALTADIDAAAAELPDAWGGGPGLRRNALAIWSLLSLDDDDELVDIPEGLRRVVAERRAAAEAAGRDLEREVIEGRYGWIDRTVATLETEVRPAVGTPSERVDRVLLHPVAGFAILLLFMGTLFQALFSWSGPAIDLVETAFGWVGGLLESALPDSILRSFLVDGVIAGVGSVVVFLPQILLLFFFIALMEDTGYMARVAFLMDRIMRRAGLHGRAFVPMLSGFACAVPAILATRTMERQRDRTLTMMVVPLMTCSARLPVYTLIIGALFPATLAFNLFPVQGLLMVAMYVFSIVTALVAAWVLGKTMLQAPQIPLILELPAYRVPHAASVLRLMWMRSAMFLREAGTVILVCTIILWGLLSFPQEPELETDYASLRTTAEAQLSGDALDTRLEELAQEERGDIFRHSYGAAIGRAMEPAIEPLGFDWKIGIGLLGAFAAREVFVSTMGVVYGIGDDVDEESTTLRQKIKAETWSDGSPVYTPLVGLSLMIFFALACQCMSTLAAVYRETHTWRWPTFLFVYMTALAWVASLVVFQGGRILGFS